MSKELLIIAATHGNEPLGLEVINRLKDKGLDDCFDYLIANPKALEKKREFIDVNLNRVYPGIKNSFLYEYGKAYNNLILAKKYRYIIDIHEASKCRDDFIIIPREKFDTKFPIEYINLNRVLFWPEPRGSISGILDNSIELEFGSKDRDRKEMCQKAADIIEAFIKKQRAKNNKYFFYVYDTLMKKDVDNKLILKDFQEASFKMEKFIPLLVNQYAGLGIVCYKMKRIVK